MGQITQFPDFQGKLARSARVYIIFGWICAVISLIFFPVLFGILGIVMGIIASKRGHRGGKVVIIASIIMMTIGIFAGAILNTYLRMFIGAFLIFNS